MSEKLKEVIVSCLHSVHDDLLHCLITMEQLLKLFGEDMSWYEQNPVPIRQEMKKE